MSSGKNKMDNKSGEQLLIIKAKIYANRKMMDQIKI